jgi:hypothetical protein
MPLRGRAHPSGNRTCPSGGMCAPQAAVRARDVIKDDFGENYRPDVIRTSARVRVYPADAVLPADKFLPSADAVKTASAGTLGCVCVDTSASARRQPSVRADAKKKN